MAGFVVHHPEIGAPRPLPGIYPVDFALERRFHACPGDLDPGQGSVLAEGHLFAHRLELSLVKLSPQLLHDHGKLPLIPGHHGLHPGGFQRAEPLLPVALRAFPGNGLGLLQRNGMEASLPPDTAHRILQHRMDEDAELRRIHLGGLPLLGLQTVFQEIQQPALRLGIHLGGGQPKLPAIEAFQR